MRIRKCAFPIEQSFRVLACITCFAAVGCQSISPGRQAVDASRDSRLRRLADDGHDQFLDGDLTVAAQKYYEAIDRAWAMDDPVEIGRISFNLAACLFSAGHNTEARDWLIEARAELNRAGQSVGNVWLLEAKIARQEERFADVMHYIAMAECSAAPCLEYGDEKSCCSGNDPCDPSCCESLPCIGSKLREKEQVEDCQLAYRAQVLLAKARQALDFGDTEAAQSYLCQAKSLIADSCQRLLQTEMHGVAAEIHVAMGQPLQAARHFDKEAYHLRLTGNYREIPMSVETAAEAYEEAGRVDLSADRLCRAARAYHGRGEQKNAWRCIVQATKLITGMMVDLPPTVSVEQASDEALVQLAPEQIWSHQIIQSDLIEFEESSFGETNVIERRLAVIAREIQRAVEADE